MTPIKIGVAGYMGCGKSTSAKYLSRDSGTIIDADSFAKDMMNSNTKIKKKLAKSFGSNVLCENRILFDVLGEIVFSSLQNLRTLNTIVHPPLLKRLHSKITEYDNKLYIVDAALISYWKIEEWFDILFWIETSEEMQLRRLAGKTAVTSEELKKRIKLQRELFVKPKEGKWIAISNEGTLSEFKESIEKKNPMNIK